MGCPYGVLRPDKLDSKVAKCNMCAHLDEDTTRCVSRCPMGAIVLEKGE